jgi:hypothetical protein
VLLETCRPLFRAGRCIPVTLAQRFLYELAGRLAWQHRLEIDALRTLDGRETAPAVVDQFACELRARGRGILWHDNRFDFFAELGVRHAEHGHIGNLGMRLQQVFAFLRIDVHATGNDDVITPIGQVQIALGIDMANVAHRCPAMLVVRTRSLLGVVVIAQRPRRLEIDQAGRAGRQLLAVVADDVQRTAHRPPDRSAMRQPFLRRDRAEADALRAAVVLVDDRPPPIEHRLLDVGWTRGRRVNRHAVTRQVT